MGKDKGKVLVGSFGCFMTDTKICDRSVTHA